MKRTIYPVLAILGAIGFIASLAMVIIAIQFGEIGRVIVYFVLGLICLEFAVWAAMVYKRK